MLIFRYKEGVIWEICSFCIGYPMISPNDARRRGGVCPPISFALSLGRANPAPTQSIYIRARPQGVPLRGMKTNAEQIGTFRNHAERCGTVRIFPHGPCRIFALSFGKNANLGAQRMHSYRRKNDNLICLTNLSKKNERL